MESLLADNQLTNQDVSENGFRDSCFSVASNQLEQKTYLVNGELRQWSGGQEEVYSPLVLEGQTPPYLGSYPSLSREEALEIANSASEAYAHGLGTWPQASAAERVQTVMSFVKDMMEVRDEVVDKIVWEIGKTKQDAEKEFDRTVEYITDSCKALLELTAVSERAIDLDDLTATVGRTPLGVTMCMGPFNYPLNETFTTLVPALLMGNTTILKPARYGVLLLEPLQKAFQKNFPPGVVNLVYGDGREVVGPIMESGKVDVLAFIGSDKVADIVIRQHPMPHRLTRILGLGAKNPAIILPDADLDFTVKKAVRGSLSFNGQRCTALKIHFVSKQIADEYASRIAYAVDEMTQGMPWDPGVTITPLAEGVEKIQFLKELIKDAENKGAKVINQDGGSVNGNLFTPAVLYPVTPSMRIYQEEQFGPIVPIVPIEDVEAATQYLAESNFGQQVSVFGSDSSFINNYSKKLAALVGRVNINDECKRGPDSLPFSGRKSSAMGTLSVEDALDVFSLPTVISKAK